MAQGGARDRDRRALIGRTALEVLAARGVRGFTHRAVDAAAGLAPGSVNHHAPTRARLLSLAMEQLFTLDVGIAMDSFAELLAQPAPSPDTVVDTMVAFVETMTSPEHRHHVVARHLLLDEARRDPVIREEFARQRARFVDFAEQALAASGQADAALLADLLVVYIEGLESRQVLAPAAPLTRDELQLAFDRFLAVLTPVP